MKSNRFGAEAQLQRIDEKARKLDDEVRKLNVDRERIVANLQRWECETGLEAWKRLKRYRIRQGHREARFLLTDERNKEASEQTPESRTLLVRAFDFLAALDKRNGTMKLSDISECLGYSKRHVIRAINLLEKYELVRRIREPGRPTHYAITLPETEMYVDALTFAVRLHFGRLQQLRERLEDYSPATGREGVAA